MRNLLKCLFAIVIFAVAGNVNAQNKEIKFEHGNWAEIMKKAKAENKLVYVDCYTSWCGPCKWMAKNVFTNDTVADFYNARFVNAEIDMEKGEGLEIAKKYGVAAYPTMLYVNGDGEIVHRGCGSSSATDFVNLGKNALDPDKQLLSKTKRFKEGNVDAVFALNYLSMLESGCQDYSKEVGSYFASQKESDLMSRANWTILYKYSNDYSSKEFAFLEKNKDAYSKLYTSDSVKYKINSVYTSGLYNAIYQPDHAADLEPLKARVKASGSPDAGKILLDADLKYFQSHTNWKEYASAAVAGADKYMHDDPMALNGIAWNFYENVDDMAALEKAAGWAKRSVEIQSMYANNDTYAAVLYKLGKKDEAKKVAEHAIALAKESGDDYSETEALLKKIEKLKASGTH